MSIRKTYFLSPRNQGILYIHQWSFYFAGDVKCLPDVAKMACQKLLVFTVMVSSLMCRNISSQQCGIDTYSIYQMMLKGHTFKTFKARPGSLDCREACNSDVRCQSYNYVFLEDICELNNRTKEARPKDFINDNHRYYMTKAPSRGKQTLQKLRWDKMNFQQFFPSILSITG